LRGAQSLSRGRVDTPGPPRWIKWQERKVNQDIKADIKGCRGENGVHTCVPHMSGGAGKARKSFARPAVSVSICSHLVAQKPPGT
jgi:hypothetical protein